MTIRLNKGPSIHIDQHAHDAIHVDLKIKCDRRVLDRAVCLADRAAEMLEPMPLRLYEYPIMLLSISSSLE